MSVHHTCQCDVVGCDEIPESHLCMSHALDTSAQSDLVHALEYTRDYLDAVTEDLMAQGGGELSISPLALAHVYQKVCAAIGDDNSIMPPAMEKKYRDIERYMMPR